MPTLLTEKAARDAYDRLASSKFNEHTCATTDASDRNGRSQLADRARALIMRGFLPKTAVEVALHELEFEFRSNPKAMAQARSEADEFLQSIRKGLI